MYNHSDRTVVFCYDIQDIEFVKRMTKMELATTALVPEEALLWVNKTPDAPQRTGELDTASEIESPQKTYSELCWAFYDDVNSSLACNQALLGKGWRFRHPCQFTTSDIVLYHPTLEQDVQWPGKHEYWIYHSRERTCSAYFSFSHQSSPTYAPLLNFILRRNITNNA